MKQFLGTMAAIIISLYSIAQQTNKLSVSGTVIDAATRKPLPSASIKLGNTVAIADVDGKFKFKKVSAGVQVLTASSIGYSESSQEIVVNTAVNNIIISLKNSPLFLQALEIKSLRSSDKAPFTKTNIGKEELAKTNIGQDLPFLLNQTPSTVVASDAGNGVGYTYLKIRGVDAGRTNVTLNGIPYNDAESQGTYFVDLPDFSSSLSSIQIQRGVGSSSNGTGAFGASINLQTNELNEKAYAEINNSIGSFNTIKNTVKVGSGLINNHFTVDARLSRIKSDGYIDRASADLQSLAFSAAYINNSSSLRFNIFSGKEKTYQAWYGVPEELLSTHRTTNPAGDEYNGSYYPNETDNYQQNHYQLFFNHSFSSKLSFNTAFFFTPGKGYYEEYKSDASYSNYGVPNPKYGNDSATSTNLVRQQWLDNKFYGQIISFQYKKANDQIIFGGGWSKYEGEHYGNVIWAQNGGFATNYSWYNNNAVKTDANIYTKWEHQLNNHLLFYADLQYKHVMHQMNGFNYEPTRKVKKEWNFYNPKVGISYNNNGWQLYGSWAVANKEPNRTDFENATNYTPKPETLNDFELGIEKKTNNYNYGATLYFMNYKDQLVLTGELDDVGNPIRINIPKSYRLGIELQGGIVANNWLSLSGNLALSSNKIKEFSNHIQVWDSASGNQLNDTISLLKNSTIAFSPNVVGGGSINITPIKNLEISLISKYVSRQFLDNSETKSRSLADYFTEDFRAIYTLHGKLLKETSLILQVNNILNRFYEPNGACYPGYTYSDVTNTSTLSNYNYFFPMAGTNFVVALNVKL